MTTYTDFQNQEASTKVGLVKLEASERLMGWTLETASIYSVSDFPSIEILSIVEGDTETTYTSVASVGALVSSSYFHDIPNGDLYVVTSDGSNPNGKFIACTYSLFFSNVSVAVPFDLEEGSRQAYWVPLLKSTSDFGVALDMDQMGVALDGTGTIQFVNDHQYWDSRFDNLYFENQRCFVYSWTPSLPISEAKLIYRGRVDSKSWNLATVSFKLKDALSELSGVPELQTISEIAGVRVPAGLLQAKQRLVYGRVSGHRGVNVDQVLTTGYPITGNLTFTNGSKVVSATGSSFLTRLSPEDQILIGDYKLSIATVDTNTQFTLSEEYEGLTETTSLATVIPENPSRFMNRVFSICGNVMRQPSTTVTSGASFNQFQVASVQDLRVGDEISVDGELTTISRISGMTLRTSTTLANFPEEGNVVLKSGLFNVKINTQELVKTRDYTYTTSGILTLDPLAEFNVAPIQSLEGDVVFTSASRSVTGTDTIFTSQLKPGDWIRAEGEFDFFEILQIISDTELLLRSNATYSETGPAQRKSTEVYDEESSVLTCSLLGKSDNALSTGNLLETAPMIVRDLLSVAGLGSLIDSDSFDDAEALSSHAIGIVIPEKYNDTRTKTFKEYIKQVNQSVFGSLYQTVDFGLGYSLLDPERPEDALLLEEKDVLSMSVTADGKNLSKSISLEYAAKEYDPETQDRFVSVQDKVSLEGTFLAKTNKVSVIKTVLSDSDSARIFAGRWAMLYERARGEMKLSTKLRASQLNITDKVRIKHEKLYQRAGQVGAQKMGLVNASKKSLGASNFDLDDLSNAFARCSTITENDAVEYSLADEKQRVLNGYITDDYGMIDNDPRTALSNKIW